MPTLRPAIGQTVAWHACTKADAASLRRFTGPWRVVDELDSPAYADKPAVRSLLLAPLSAGGRPSASLARWVPEDAVYRVFSGACAKPAT